MLEKNPVWTEPVVDFPSLISFFFQEGGKESRKQSDRKLYKKQGKNNIQTDLKRIFDTFDHL